LGKYANGKPEKSACKYLLKIEKYARRTGSYS